MPRCASGAGHARTRVARFGRRSVWSDGSGCWLWDGWVGRGGMPRVGHGVPLRAALWGAAYGVAARRGLKVEAWCGVARCVRPGHAMVRHPGRWMRRAFGRGSEAWREARARAVRAGALLMRRVSSWEALSEADVLWAMRETGAGRVTVLCGWSLAVAEELRQRKSSSVSDVEAEG